MRLSYLHKSVTTDEVIYRNFQNVLEFRIGDIRSYADVCSVLRDVDIVANAAALKQVPTCEYFPVQAIQTNCLGPQNIVQAIREHGFPVETVIGISTDKACKPVNAITPSPIWQLGRTTDYADWWNCSQLSRCRVQGSLPVSRSLRMIVF